jgi:hypothetical protein
MRISLLRRVMFVAILWGAVAFGSTASLEATYCADCAPIWSACQNNCYSLYFPNSQQELEECLDDCEADYWECTFTCDSGPYCSGWTGCSSDYECQYVCSWQPAYCDQQNQRCCCSF